MSKQGNLPEKQNNDGGYRQEWQPAGDEKKHSLGLPRGGGEKSRPERIELNIARIVHEHKEDSATNLANYILSQLDNNVRLNPARIIEAAKLPEKLARDVSALILYEIIRRKREEPK